MAELEIHTKSEHEPDPRGQKVGILAALLAVGLAMVTIASHRAHTTGVLLRTEANDQWAHYQSQRLKLHNLELGEDLIRLLGTKNAATDRALERYRSEKYRRRRIEKGAGRSTPKEIEGEAAERARCTTISVKGCWRSRWC